MVENAPDMIFRIKELALEAAGGDPGKLNSNVAWVLNYFPKDKATPDLLAALRVADERFVSIEFDEQIVTQAQIKFGFCTAELLSALGVLAAALGGAE